MFLFIVDVVIDKPIEIIVSELPSSDRQDQIIKLGLKKEMDVYLVLFHYFLSKKFRNVIY